MIALIFNVKLNFHIIELKNLKCAVMYNKLEFYSQNDLHLRLGEGNTKIEKMKL